VVCHAAPVAPKAKVAKKVAALKKKAKPVAKKKKR
jgi:hypothetical protein